MILGKGISWRKHKWHISIVAVVVVTVVILVFFTDIFRGSQVGSFGQFIWLLVGALSLATIIITLSLVFKIVSGIIETVSKLDQLVETQQKNHVELTQINQRSRLSETAKAIAFRDADRQMLWETVFEKLHQQDFKTTYEIIDQIAHQPEYKELAEQLRVQANKYHDATDQERVNQVLSHIENLLDNLQWTRASAQIERLIQTDPTSEKARSMRQRLKDKKEERKKELLQAWDDAVKREDTDQGIDILRQLDMYLTPSEGLALQEAARDVFRTKLHNMGVQFSLAVSGRQWDKALETGKQIIRDFPNSKMAEEIREKMDILKQRAAG